MIRLRVTVRSRIRVRFRVSVRVAFRVSVRVGFVMVGFGVILPEALSSEFLRTILENFNLSTIDVVWREYSLSLYSVWS